MRAGWFALLCAAGCYSPSYDDCAISCTSGHGCPDGYTCDEALGRCRKHGAASTCATAMPDSRPADAGGCGFAFATNFDPCAVAQTNDNWMLSGIVMLDTSTGAGNV